MKKPVFVGSGVAIITPFTKDGVDLAALRRLLRFHLAEGSDAVIVCGTTGEASTMSRDERLLVMETAMPLPIPTNNTVIASTALTQEPVTNCPIGLVSACRATKSASITAVSVIQRSFLFIENSFLP